MSEAITFELKVNMPQGIGAKPTWTIVEVKTGLPRGEFTSGKARAEAVYAHLTAEHANGRVAQATCGKRGVGGPCDRERIHMPEMLTDAQREAVILCDGHTYEIDTLRARAKR